MFTLADGKTVQLYMETERFAGNIEVDLDVEDPLWRNKTIGYRITFDGSQTTMALLIDFVETTHSFTLDNAITFRVFESGQALEEVGRFSNGEMQESVLFNSALSDSDLLTLKQAWENNK